MPMPLIPRPANIHCFTSVRDTSLDCVTLKIRTSDGADSRQVAKEGARNARNTTPYITRCDNVIGCFEKNTLFTGNVNPPSRSGRAYLAIESLCRTCHIVAVFPTADNRGDSTLPAALCNSRIRRDIPSSLIRATPHASLLQQHGRHFEPAISVAPTPGGPPPH